MRANATVIFFARSSNDPMQPTQNSTSGRSPRSDELGHRRDLEPLGPAGAIGRR